MYYMRKCYALLSYLLSYPLFSAKALQDPVDKVADAYFNDIVKKCHFHHVFTVYNSPKFFTNHVICLQEDNKSDLVITYTAMHGVGAEWVKRAFSVFGLNDYVPVVQQISPDPEFPTVAFPNPEEGKGALVRIG